MEINDSSKAMNGCGRVRKTGNQKCAITQIRKALIIAMLNPTANETSQ